MDFEEFDKLPTATQKGRELLRMKFRSLAALERVVEQNEAIIKLLNKLNKKE